MELYEEAEKSNVRVIFRYPAGRVSLRCFWYTGCMLWWAGMNFVASGDPGRSGKASGLHSFPGLMFKVALWPGLVFLICAAVSIWQQRSLEVDTESRTLRRITRLPFWKWQEVIRFDDVASLQLKVFVPDRRGEIPDSEVAMILTEGRMIRLGRGDLPKARTLAGRLANLTGSSVSMAGEGL
jgi:hypothetical protein